MLVDRVAESGLPSVPRNFGRPLRTSAERLTFVLQRDGGGLSGLENLDFFTDKLLVDDPYDYYDAIRRCPIRREPAHGVVMVSGYDEAVAVQRDADRTLSVCNIVSGPWSGIPIETDSDDISDLIERHRQRVTFGEYFISFDPPKHTAHRSLLSRLFTPKQLKNNEDLDRKSTRLNSSHITPSRMPSSA